MNPLLQLEKLGKSFAGPHGPVQVLDGVSLQVNAGEFVSLQGPSGCGKSTLLLGIGGLLQPSHGRVLLKGQDLYSLSPGERATVRAKNIGFVFQQFHLIPYLNVLENVLTPLLANPTVNALGLARDLLAQFKLQHRERHLPSELSTGERQRTALARAFLSAPKLLLADEPTGNLDAENSRIVLEALAQFTRKGGAVLLVTHDSGAAQAAGRHLHLCHGRLVAGPCVSVSS